MVIAYEQATQHRRSPPIVPPLAESLVTGFIGTWQLLGIHQRDHASREKSAADESGQWTVDLRRERPIGGLQIVRNRGKRLPVSSVSSYFGRWELAPIEGCVVHHSDASFNVGRAANSEKQRYSFDAAGQLSLAAMSPLVRLIRSSFGNVSLRWRLTALCWPYTSAKHEHTASPATFSLSKRQS